MKRNEPVTQKEHPLNSGDTLISTTDLRGVITSVNKDFVRIAGFSEEELENRPHNMIRHPDMPQAAFEDMWRTLKTGKPWMGLVKNRCKNGDHYFVDAYVTPVYEGGQVTGYQSVRFQPERSVIERGMRLYARLRQGQSAFWTRFLPRNLGFAHKWWLLAVLVSLPTLVFALSGGAFSPWWLLAVTLGVSLVACYGLLSPLVALGRRSREYFDNAVARAVYTGRGDELGQLELAIKALRSQNRTILARIENVAGDLGDVADETYGIVEQTTEGVQRQQQEVDQLATAMHEMAATVAEVAKNADSTAGASSEATNQAGEGERLVNSAVADIGALSETVQEATRVIEKLRDDSENIGSVVDVISNIASETNLLALNAAIEAARAGEQGRGFAVVADEVRNLASNTQQSTEEIQQMIKVVQQSSSNAVTAMEQGRQRADHSVEQAHRVGESFAEISRSISTISGLNTQVATAAEQQSSVAEEMNRNVTAINDVANQTLDHANNTAEASKRLTDMVAGLRSVVRQFGEV